MLRQATIILALMWLGLLLAPPSAWEAVALTGMAAVLLVLIRDRRQQRRSTGYVYLMGGHPDGIKIGRTNDLARRLKEHQTALPEAYYIVTLPARNPAALERRLHQTYAGKRIWPDREYFRLTNADLRDIRRM